MDAVELSDLLTEAANRIKGLQHLVDQQRKVTNA
jgi:hypothetical protein